MEYTYPSKDELIKNNKIISYLIEDKNKTKENVIDDLFFQLTCVCLPDGIHASNRDTQFFIIQDYKYPLFGISCYKLKVLEMIQKKTPDFLFKKVYV